MKFLRKILDRIEPNFIDNGRFSKFYHKLSARIPNDKDAVFSMVAPEEFEEFEKFVISQKGSISSSIEVLRSGLTDKFQYTDIGLAGHP